MQQQHSNIDYNDYALVKHVFDHKGGYMYTDSKQITKEQYMSVHCDEQLELVHEALTACDLPACVIDQAPKSSN